MQAITNGAVGTVGAWIRDALGESGDPTSVRVRELVPQCYASYVRVFHPVPLPFGGFRRWRDLLDGTVDAATTWDDGGGPVPSTGVLEQPDLTTLLSILGADDVYAAVSADAGVFDPAPNRHLGIDPDGRPFLSRPVPLTALAESTRHADVLDLPRARCHVVSVRADALGALASALGAGPSTLSPRVVWPHDRSWCVVTDALLDSTIVGCTESVADAILASDQLETAEIAPDDPLSAD